MRKFKVTVEGQTYDVLVEEISDSEQLATTPAPAKQNLAAPTEPVKAPEDNKPSPPSPAPAASAEETGTSVPAPMPGSVIEVKVKTGEAVAEGDVLLILEAMKMENEITAPVKGTVTKIAVAAGDTVNTSDALVYIA